MTPKDYIEYTLYDYLLSEEFDKIAAPAGNRWRSKDEVVKAFHDAVPLAFKKIGINDAPPIELLGIGDLISDLIRNKVIEERQVDLAGNYVRLTISSKDEAIETLLSSNPVAELAKEFDSTLLINALNNIKDIPNWGLEGIDDRSLQMTTHFVPGSDRVVTLKDNQPIELGNKTDQVIDLLSKENSINGESGLHDRILGQLRAGKELLIAGVFKLELLRISLIESLIFLIQRYEREAIGAAASVLLAELVKAVS